MARRASNRGMRARQRERRVVVIKHRARPRNCRVARCAGRRESRRNMVRVRSSHILRLVAGVAVRWRTHKYVIDMAR